MNIIRTTFEKLGTFINDNTTTVMTGIGIGGFLAASYFVGKGVLNADRRLREAKEKDPEVEISTGEIVKVYTISLLPAIILIVGSTAIIITANALEVKDKTALGALVVAGEQKFKDYKNKMKEELGEKKEKEFSSEIQAKQVREVDSRTINVVSTGKGDTLFYDEQTGTYFESSIPAVRSAVNLLNSELLERAQRMNCGLDVDTNVYVTLNDFRGFLGLEPIKFGDYIGYGLQEGGLFDVEEPFTVVETQDGRRCILLQYEMYSIADKDRYQYI